MLNHDDCVIRCLNGDLQLTYQSVLRPLSGDFTVNASLPHEHDKRFLKFFLSNCSLLKYSIILGPLALDIKYDKRCWLPVLPSKRIGTPQPFPVIILATLSAISREWHPVRSSRPHLKWYGVARTFWTSFSGHHRLHLSTSMPSNAT